MSVSGSVGDNTGAVGAARRGSRRRAHMKFARTGIVGAFLLALAGAVLAQEPAATEKWCRKVGHLPQQPKPGEKVRVTATIVEGNSDVKLEYQVVEPGAYIELKDPAYAEGWVSVPMRA